MNNARVPSARPRTLAQWIGERLTRSIVLGERAPREVVREQDVIEKFRTSRTPCREAFLMLERRNLVDAAAYKAKIIRELNRGEAEDLFACWLQVDPLASGLAATRATDDALARANELLRVLDSAANAGNRGAFYDAMRDLDSWLLSLAESGFLLQLHEVVIHQANRLRFLTFTSPSDLLRSAGTKSNLVARIRQRDPVGAADAMRSIIAATANAVRPLLHTES